MTAEITAEQLEAELSSKMGPQFGAFYYALYKEVVWLHAKWNEYRVLFGTSQERVALLNKIASFFFRVVEDALWEDVLLHISRLTDREKTKGQKNLTVRGLIGFLEEGPLKSQIAALVDAAVAKSEFAREHRNKRLAHKDLLHATEPRAAPLSGISRAHIEEMLGALRNVMAPLDHHYRDTTVAYEHFISRKGAESLVSRLRSFEKAESAL